MRVISYNLRKNRASVELEALVNRYNPDMLCLQEADTLALPAEISTLHLADATSRNRLGLAMYYRKDRFAAVETRTFALKKSLHDRLLTPAHERLIGTRLKDHAAERELVVASFHAAPLTARNSLRRNQIRSAHEELHTLGPGLPTLMVGDYNYPLFKENLSEKVQSRGLRPHAQRQQDVYPVQGVPRALRLGDVDRAVHRQHRDPSAGYLRPHADSGERHLQRCGDAKRAGARGPVTGSGVGGRTFTTI